MHMHAYAAISIHALRRVVQVPALGLRSKLHTFAV